MPLSPTTLRRALLLLPLLLLLLAGCDLANLPKPAPTTIPTPLVAGSRPTIAEAEPTSTRQEPTSTEVEPTSTDVTPAATEVEPTSTETEPTSTAEPSPTRGRGGNTPTQEQPTPTVRRSPRSSPTTLPSPTEPNTTPQSGSPTSTLIPQSQRLDLFTQVWETVNDNYLYQDFNGVDWDTVRVEYEQRVEAATSTPQFYELLAEMVDELGDDHSRFLTPQEVEEEEAHMNGAIDYVGIGILGNLKDRVMRVVYVFPGSPAEGAGLKRRDRITAVDGKPFPDDDSAPSILRGPEGTTLTLTVISPGKQPRQVRVTRRAIRGAIEPWSSRLQTDSKIGYLAIPDLFVEDMGEQVEAELDKLLSGEPLDGLVMDLRGNGGGLRTVLQSILGQFVSGNVGSFYTQEDDDPFNIERGQYYERLKDVPLVVLVDSGTESYAEVLAATLRAGGGARIVGVPSAGNTETVYPFDFGDGSRVWVAVESFRLPDNTNLEGKGVAPDVEIDVDWTEYAEKDDPHILKAVELIRQEQRR